MSDTPKKFYLTTPIYYVNARPHIGHAYTTIVADVIARRHRLLGDNTFFLTGTDEHGQKIERSAIAAGIPPQQFADTVSKSFRDLWVRMGILDDSLSKDDPLLHRDFIRTTDPRHKAGVQKLFQLLKARGHIYLSTYTGQYCVSDEAYVDGPPGIRCPDCGRTTETVSESNYYFRLSAFQLPLLNLIESGQLLITPESRRNEVLSFVRGNLVGAAGMMLVGDPGILEQGLNFAEINEGLSNRRLKRSEAGFLYVPGALKDLSISRTSFHWGVPVPGDEAHVIYVWLDALANYMTAIGYGSDDPADIANFERFWPADLHLVGKEIIRFHCIYWPAFLLAAGLPTPKAITAHGWLLFQDSANEATKMSKSKGNIVRTETILDAFGQLCPPDYIPPIDVDSDDTGRAWKKGARSLGTFLPVTQKEQDLFASDVLRYFLLREIPFGQDGSFSFEALIQRYNADLANGYGNLVSRSLKLVQQNFESGLEQPVQPWLCEDRQSGFEDEAPETVREAYSGTAAVIRKIAQLADDFPVWFKQHRFQVCLAEIGVAVSTVDSYLSWNKPWLLAKQSDPVFRRKLSEILYTAAEAIRIITALLYPFLPYATAQVWSQLGLGSIEQAARNGDLKDLKWGGLEPGTKLGPLAPIFPRADVTADKGLAHLMANLEKNHLAANTGKNMDQPKDQNQPQDQNQPPAPSRLTNETTTATPETPLDPTHPGAPPRTSALPEPDPIAKVAGSDSAHTQLPRTPSHTEAFASGPFNTAQSSQPIAPSSIQNPAASPSTQSQQPAIAAPTTTPAEGPLSSATKEGRNSSTQTEGRNSSAQTEGRVSSTQTEGRDSSTQMEGPGFSRAETSPAEGGTALPKAALPNPAASPQGTAQITIDDFAKVELRVARILVAERIPKADKLLRLEVDLGTEQRQILSGIAEWYTPEDLIGRKIVVITNLAPRKMRGLESHGMLLAASSGENGKPALATFNEADTIEVGARLK